MERRNIFIMTQDSISEVEKPWLPREIRTKIWEYWLLPWLTPALVQLSGENRRYPIQCHNRNDLPHGSPYLQLGLVSKDVMEDVDFLLRKHHRVLVEPQRQNVQFYGHPSFNGIFVDLAQDVFHIGRSFIYRRMQLLRDRPFDSWTLSHNDQQPRQIMINLQPMRHLLEELVSGISVVSLIDLHATIRQVDPIRDFQIVFGLAKHLPCPIQSLTVFVPKSIPNRRERFERDLEIPPDHNLVGSDIKLVSCPSDTSETSCEPVLALGTSDLHIRYLLDVIRNWRVLMDEAEKKSVELPTLQFVYRP